jgi:hypothetical protein
MIILTGLFLAWFGCFLLQGWASLAIGFYTLLVAEGDYAHLNPPEWIERLRQLVVLLSVAARDRQSLPSP